MVNAGQSCIAGKRFIVVKAVREAFERAFLDAMNAYAMGDPRDDGTKLGPLQSGAARDEVHKQVEASVAAGARLLAGGEVPDRPGAWYPATVLGGVRPGIPVYEEEVFGPVAAIIEATDEADAIRIANGSRFGLGSGVLTRDLARGERIAADELEVGRQLRQRQRALRPAHAVRRHQGFRLRARMLLFRHPRVHQHQERARRGLKHSGNPWCCRPGKPPSRLIRRCEARRAEP